MNLVEVVLRVRDDLGPGLAAASAKIDAIDAKWKSSAAAQGGFLGGASNVLRNLLPIAPALTGISGALLGATAGFAAFGAVAIPVIKNAVTATSALVTANSAFDTASALVSTAIKNNTKDLAIYKAAQVGLTPVQKSVEQLLGVQGTRWQDLSKAQQNAAVGLLENKKAMSAMLPAQATALRQLVAQGQAYQQLTPAQQAFGAGLTNLNTAWQKMQNAITPTLLKVAADAMKYLGQTVTIVGGMAQAAAPGVRTLIDTFLIFINQVLKTLAPLIQPGLQAFNMLLKIVTQLVITALRPLVVVMLETLPALKFLLIVLTPILAVISALVVHLGPLLTAFVYLVAIVKTITLVTKAWAVAQGILDVVLAANPIGIVILAIAALIAIIVVVVTHFKFFKNIVVDVWDWIKSHWPLLVGIIGGPIGIVVALIITHFTTIKNFVVRVWNDIVGFLSSAGSRILHDVSSWVSGVINFIWSIPSRIAGIGGRIAGEILSGLKSLPGKVLSYIGLAHGGVVGAAVGGAHGGLRLVGEHGPELVKLPSGSTVMSNPDTMAALGGSGGGGVVQLEVVAGGASDFEQFMVQAIRNWVRVRGGGGTNSVQKTFGMTA